MAPRPLRPSPLRTLAVYLAATLCVPFPVWGNPQGPHSAPGSHDAPVIDGNTLYLGGIKNNAIVDWDSFDIEKGETSIFHFSNGGDRMLNRDLGAVGDPRSVIEGVLRSNGQVYLANPHGIFIGPNGYIDTHSFYAIGGDIANQDFLLGRDLFKLTADVENHGEIHARGDAVDCCSPPSEVPPSGEPPLTISVSAGTPGAGVAALIGRHVRNYGTVSAPAGGVAILAAGDTVELIGIKEAPHVRVVASGGDPGGVGVDNRPGNGDEEPGSVTGGNVVLAAADSYALGVNHAGRIEAVPAGEGPEAGHEVVLQSPSGIQLDSATGPASIDTPNAKFDGDVSITNDYTLKVPGKATFTGQIRAAQGSDHPDLAIDGQDVNVAGAIGAGTATLGDVDLSAGNHLTTSDVTAGGDVVADGGFGDIPEGDASALDVQMGNLRAGEKVDILGNGRDVAVGDVTAGGDVFIASGLYEAVSSGNLRAGGIDAGGTVELDATGDLTVGNLTADGWVYVDTDWGKGGAAHTGDIQSGEDVNVYAADDIETEDVDAGKSIYIYAGGDVRTGALAAATDVTVEAGCNCEVSGVRTEGPTVLAAPTGNAAVLADEPGASIKGVTAGEDVVLTAPGDIVVDGDVTARNVDLEAGDDITAGNLTAQGWVLADAGTSDDPEDQSDATLQLGKVMAGSDVDLYANSDVTTRDIQAGGYVLIDAGSFGADAPEQPLGSANTGDIDAGDFVEIFGDVDVHTGDLSGEFVDLYAGHDVTSGNLKALGALGYGFVSVDAGNDVHTGNIELESIGYEYGGVDVVAGRDAFTGDVTSSTYVDVSAGRDANTGNLTAGSTVRVEAGAPDCIGCGGDDGGPLLPLVVGSGNATTKDIEAGQWVRVTAPGDVTTGDIALLDAVGYVHVEVDAGHDAKTGDIAVDASQDPDAFVYEAYVDVAGGNDATTGNIRLTAPEGVDDVRVSVEAGNDASTGNVDAPGALTDVDVIAGRNATTEVVQAGHDVFIGAEGGTATTAGATAGEDVDITAGTDVQANGPVTATAGNATITAGANATTQAVNAGVDVKVDAGGSATTGAVVAGHDALVNGGMDATTGVVTAAHDAVIRADTGKATTTGVTAGNEVEIAGGTDVEATGPVTAAAGNATITAGANATLQAVNAAVDVVVAAGADATTGNVSAGHDALVNGGADATTGVVTAGHDATIRAETGKASSAGVTAVHAVQIDAGTDIETTGPVSASAGSVTLTAMRDLTTRDQVHAADDVTLTAENGDVTSRALVVADAGDVTIQGGGSATTADVSAPAGNVKITGRSGDVRTDGVEAGGNATLTGDRDVSTARLEAGGDVAVNAGRNARSRGAVRAGGEVTIHAKRGNVSAKNVTAGRNLDLSAGGTVDVADLRAPGGDVSVAAGGSATTGDVAARSVSVDARDAVETGNVRASGGDVSVASREGSVGVGDVDARSGGITLAALDRISIGNLAARDLVSLQTAPGNVPDVATIVGRNPNAPLEISANQIQMGRNDKLSHPSRVTLVASDWIEAGDLNALALEIRTGTLTLLPRGPGNVLRPDGSRLPDRGRDVVANEIDLLVDTLVDNGARFATATGLIGGNSSSISADRRFVLTQALERGDFTRGGTVFDLLALDVEGTTGTISDPIEDGGLVDPNHTDELVPTLNYAALYPLSLPEASFTSSGKAVADYISCAVYEEEDMPERCRELMAEIEEGELPTGLGAEVVSSNDMLTAIGQMQKLRDLSADPRIREGFATAVASTEAPAVGGAAEQRRGRRMRALIETDPQQGAVRRYLDEAALLLRTLEKVEFEGDAAKAAQEYQEMRMELLDEIRGYLGLEGIDPGDLGEAIQAGAATPPDHAKLLRELIEQGYLTAMRVETPDGRSAWLVR